MSLSFSGPPLPRSRVRVFAYCLSGRAGGLAVLVVGFVAGPVAGLVIGCVRVAGAVSVAGAVAGAVAGTAGLEVVDGFVPVVGAICMGRVPAMRVVGASGGGRGAPCLWMAYLAITTVAMMATSAAATCAARRSDLGFSTLRSAVVRTDGLGGSGTIYACPQAGHLSFLPA